MADLADDVRSWGAGSTGRRNTGVKSLCWGFKLQGLTWSFVELTSHFVQIGLRVHRQVGALRKVLSQQAVGVLVRPALPRALRIAKINVDVGRQRKATMIRKFLSSVPGQGFIQLRWQLLRLLDERGDYRLGVLTCHLGLPRALRIAKINVDVGRQRKATMIRKFLASVPGQGFIQLRWQLLRLLDERGDDRLGVLTCH